MVRFKMRVWFPYPVRSFRNFHFENHGTTFMTVLLAQSALQPLLPRHLCPGFISVVYSSIVIILRDIVNHKTCGK